MMADAMAQAQSRHQDSGEFETSPFCSFGEVSNALLLHLAARISSDSDDGTSFAIDYSISGVAADSARGSRRGGAHNSAARQSHALTAAQIGNLRAAERHAVRVGLPFTRMITIHWEAAGVPLEGMAKATGRFLDLMSKALSRHGSSTAWLWVHENGEMKGGHCHLLVHIPAQLAATITRLQRRWLRRITGRPYKRRVIRSKPIGGRLGVEATCPEQHAVNLDAALGYVLKGASSYVAELLGLSRLEPGGLVIGKRCGTSQNIGSKARDKAETVR